MFLVLKFTRNSSVNLQTHAWFEVVAQRIDPYSFRETWRGEGCRMKIVSARTHSSVQSAASVSLLFSAYLCRVYEYYL